MRDPDGEQSGFNTAENKQSQQRHAHENVRHDQRQGDERVNARSAATDRKRCNAYAASVPRTIAASEAERAILSVIQSDSHTSPPPRAFHTSSR
jgi:hypothetical protein